MKISACWIAKNEAKNILKSIEHLKDMVDELVVVDTGSTDDTVEIARAAGAKIEYFEWIGDFSAARNYALSCTSGDIAFFLDADEWFEPALTAGDRQYFEKTFTENPTLDSIQVRINNLNSEGAVKTTTIANRILRKRGDLEFQKRIHEQFLRKNGLPPNSICLEGWSIGHSGYTEDILGNKMKRNIKLLELAAENSEDAQDRHLQHLYLVREYYQQHNLAESSRHLRIVLDEPDLIRRQCITYQHGIAPLIYLLIIVAGDARNKVSRREIYRKVVENFKKYIEDYCGVPTLDLFYNSIFDLKEDLLLAKIASALEAARKMTPSPVTYYFEAEMKINHQAADASLKRGRLAAAMDYAVEAFKNTPNKDPRTLHILLTCLHGQPAGDIILFLNSQFNLNNPERLEYLATGTRLYGFNDVHAYYLNKKIVAGIGTKGDYLYLLLIYGKFEDFVRKTLEFSNENNNDFVSQNLFLAALCSKNELIYTEHKELLHDYAHILDAFFAGTSLSSFTERDAQILSNNFDLFAFAAGLPRAEELLRVFAGLAVLCFQVKARYCVNNALYEQVCNEPSPDPTDYFSNSQIIIAMTMTGRCKIAFDMIKSYFDTGNVNDTMLKYLLAIAEHAKSPADIKTMARKLYDRYITLFDRLIDLGDIVKTGYVSDDSEKKKARSFKSLNPAQFNKQLAEDAAKPFISNLAQIHEQAGAIYFEKSMHAMAVECYRFAVAQNHNPAENYAKLSELFAKIGNYQLSGELKKRSNIVN